MTKTYSSNMLIKDLLAKKCLRCKKLTEFENLEGLICKQCSKLLKDREKKISYNIKYGKRNGQTTKV
jgi:DNA-directed RNA polymerase subunit RPC12/RpoP